MGCLPTIEDNVKHCTLSIVQYDTNSASIFWSACSGASEGVTAESEKGMFQTPELTRRWPPGKFSVLDLPTWTRSVRTQAHERGVALSSWTVRPPNEECATWESGAVIILSEAIGNAKSESLINLMDAFGVERSASRFWAVASTMIA